MTDLAARLTLLARIGVLTIAPGGRFALDMDAVDALVDGVFAHPHLAAA